MYRYWILVTVCGSVVKINNSAHKWANTLTYHAQARSKIMALYMGHVVHRCMEMNPPLTSLLIH